MVGAVGVMGSDDNHPGDLMYIGVLAVGVIGAIIGRFQPLKVARALFATALAQVSVAVIAVVAGMQSPAAPVAEILVLNGFFAALFVGSALLFRKAARDQAPVDA